MKKISQKTRVIIYIAVIIAIIAFGAMAVLSQRSGGESLLNEKLELGQQYLLELSYDKAVLEFTDAINIEPKNADAYIGLAEAYRGMGDHEKADEVLRLGFEKNRRRKAECCSCDGDNHGNNAARNRDKHCHSKSDNCNNCYRTLRNNNSKA